MRSSLRRPITPALPESDFMLLDELGARLSTTTNALYIRISRAIRQHRTRTEDKVVIVGGDDELPPIIKLHSRWGTWRPVYQAWLQQRSAKLIEVQTKRPVGRPRNQHTVVKGAA